MEKKGKLNFGSHVLCCFGFQKTEKLASIKPSQGFGFLRSRKMNALFLSNQTERCGFPFFFFSLISYLLCLPILESKIWIVMCGLKYSGSGKHNWAESPSSIVNHFGTSGISVAIATSLTHPLDVLKVRLQMQLVGQRGPLTRMGQLFVQVVKKEGPGSLYLGLTPALIRSVLYGGLRLGLYEPSKNVCEWAFGSTNILIKIASGAFSGAIATALTNPLEVLKVRLQMNSNLRRGGAIMEMHRIASEEGIKALWKGVGPAMARAAALTASQLATYDESKRVLIRWTPLEEGFHLHLISSTVSGTVSTLITAPVDIIKTRLMLQRESKRAGSYKNGFHCAYQVMLTEGPKALYKGGLAIFARLGPQTTITFILCEKLRELAGLDAI